MYGSNHACRIQKFCKMSIRSDVDLPPWRRKRRERAAENDIEVDPEAWESLLRRTTAMLLKTKRENIDVAEAAMKNYVVETLRDVENDDSE